MGKRIAHYDNARGILILFVVLGHILAAANPNWDIRAYNLAHGFLTAFHMPAFFLLSGMLFNGEKWRKKGWAAFLIQKAKALLVPYVFFELLGILYKHFVLGTVSIPDGLLLLATLRCNIGADWFLPAMFVSNLLFYACCRYLPQGRTGKLLLAVLAGLCLFSAWVLPRGLFLDTLIRGLLGFAFMAVGQLLREPLDAHNLPKTTLSFALTVGFAALTLKFAKNDFYECRVTDPPLFLLCALAGTSFVLGVSKMIRWRPLAWLGENSIVVMGTHQLALYTVRGSTSPLWVLSVFALILALEVPLILLLNRFCPFFVGKRFKGEHHEKKRT